MSSIIEFEISDKLRQHGVTRFEREGTTLLLMNKDKSIIFSIQKEGFFQTVREFEKVSKDKIDQQTLQAIIFQLSSDKYYQNVLRSDYVNHKEEFKRELILKLGNAFERVVANPESICEEIKNTSRDEISEKVISSRNVDEYITQQKGYIAHCPKWRCDACIVFLMQSGGGGCSDDTIYKIACCCRCHSATTAAKESSSRIVKAEVVI